MAQRMNMKKYLPYLLLLLFSIPLFFLGVKDAHGLGDDFAQYVKEAENISKGLPYYTTNWVFNNLDWGYGPPQYPPGYPMLLAPVVKVFGIAIRPMLYMNALLAMALLFALFAYFRKYAGAVASVCLALIIVYSGELLQAKGELLSDMPCTLFVVLYLMVRNSTAFSVSRLLLLMCIATMIILIRSQGLVMLAAEGLYLILSVYRLIRAKELSLPNISKLPSLWLVTGTCLLYFMVNNIIFRAPASTFNYYTSMASHMETTFWQMVKDNFSYLQSLFEALLHYPTRMYFNSFANLIGSTAFYIGLIGFIIALFGKLRVDDLFFILMCLIIIFMPIHQGARFLYEAFPVYMLYGYTAMRRLLPALLESKSKGIAVAITAVYLFIGIDDFKKQSKNECMGCVPDRFTIAIFDYLNAHMSDSDIVACPRPRLITLFTGKRAIVYASKATDEENKRKFDELKVRYMIPWFDDNMRKFMRANYVLLDSQKTGDTEVYRVR